MTSLTRSLTYSFALFTLAAGCVDAPQDPHADDEGMSPGGKADDPTALGCGAGEWERSVVAHTQASNANPTANLAIGVSSDGTPTIAFPDPTSADPYANVSVGTRKSSGAWDVKRIFEGTASGLAMQVAPDGSATLCFANSESRGGLGCTDRTATGTWRSLRSQTEWLGEHDIIQNVGNMARSSDGTLILGFTTLHRVETASGTIEFSKYQANLGVRHESGGLFSPVAVAVQGEPSWYKHVTPAVGFGPDGAAYVEVGGTVRSSDNPWAEWPHEEFEIKGVFPSQQVLAVRDDGKVWMSQKDPNREVFDVQAVSAGINGNELSWIRDTPGFRVGRGAYSFTMPIAMGRDSHDRLHVVAIADDKSPMHAVRNSDGSWSVERIEGLNVSATLPTLAIGEDDALHVAYLDSSINNIVYARRSCQP